MECLVLVAFRIFLKARTGPVPGLSKKDPWSTDTCLAVVTELSELLNGIILIFGILKEL